MAIDRNQVNFGEDYELNRHLRKEGKRQTQENRDALKAIGDKVKKDLGKTRLTHGELEEGIKKNKSKLD